MRPAAHVSSIEALRHFKAGLTEFGTLIRTALGEAQSDVQRTTWWIQNDQLAHWKSQKRKRENRLAQAKAELFRAEAASEDTRTSAVLERKAVEKAQHALDEAETRIANVKRWSRLLDRETILFKGQCQQLARAVDGDLPQALARLEKMIRALERYVQLAAPAADPHPPSEERTR